jgi:hypothetical protein
MFGKLSSRKQKQLRESGTRAVATVLSVAEKGMAITNGADNVVSNTTLALKTTLRVEPTGEPAFEITERFRYSQFGVPIVGQKVGVIFDPEDHETIMIDDQSGVVPFDSMAQLRAATGEPEPAVGGSPVAGMAGMGGTDLNAMLSSIQSAKEQSGGDPQKLAQILQGQFGPGATVISSSDEGAKYVTWPPPGTSAAPPPGPDPETAKIDQLERLAKLHASGALTDAEFADQKARVLGEGR